MVSAVFHSPLAAVSDGNAIKKEAAHQDSTRASGSNPLIHPAQTVVPTEPGTRVDWRALVMAVLPPVLGLGLLIGIWALVSIGTASSIPSPPLCKVITLATRLNPKPLPGFERLSSSRTNRPNTRSRSSKFIPMPWSATSIITV